MFQAFIVICAIGTEPSFDNCIVQVQPAIYPDENVCVNSIASHLDTLNNTGVLDEFEVHNIGCHKYLIVEDKTKA